MANMNKLRGKIIENGMTIETLSEAVGINRATFYRKIADNGASFTIREADVIMRTLHLSAEDAFAIFFSPNVA